MYNIGNLPQIINSLNGMVIGVSSELEKLKNEVNALKSSVVNQAPTNTNVNIDVTELETRITNIQTTLDNEIKSRKSDILRIDALSNKETINHKDVQAMIDHSIALLLDGLRSPPPTSTHLTPINEVDETLDANVILEHGNHEHHEHQDGTPLEAVEVAEVVEVDTPKPKGRGGRKKKVVQ